MQFEKLSLKIGLLFWDFALNLRSSSPFSCRQKNSNHTNMIMSQNNEHVLMNYRTISVDVSKKLRRNRFLFERFR